MLKINIAVVSDLHCHHSRKFRIDDPINNSSHLISDLARLPANKHPVESLLKLIKENENIEADYLLCPGDITNQVDVQGFISGWNYIKEIGSALSKSTPIDIIATLGNHDVDSRYNISKDDVFKIAQGIGLDFPFKNQTEAANFWSKGFSFIEYDEIRFLVINTVKFHTNKDSAVSGKMDEKQLEEIKNYLATKNDNKIWNCNIKVDI